MPICPKCKLPMSDFKPEIPRLPWTPEWVDEVKLYRCRNCGYVEAYVR